MLALCAIVVFELIVLQINRIASAFMVFNAFVASMAIFTVVFKDVAVVSISMDSISTNNTVGRML